MSLHYLPNFEILKWEKLVALCLFYASRTFDQQARKLLFKLKLLNIMSYFA